jgi:hypothetical protein
MVINRKSSKPVRHWLTLLSKPFFRVVYFIGTCVVLVLAVIFVYGVDPSSNPFTPGCSFYRITGLYCPTCGMTRAAHHALHGRFRKAFSLNVLWPAIILLLGSSLGVWFFWLVTGKNPFHRLNRILKHYPAITWLILVPLFAFWIFRNIPVFPFSWLAP